MDAFERYELARSLRNQPTIASVHRLVALLVDDGTFVAHEAPAPYDVETTYGHVADAARESLVAMLPVVLASLAEVLPKAGTEQVRALLGVIDGADIAQRIALPDDAHAALVAAAEGVDDTRASAARFERDFARRVRSHELADPEAYWRAWLAHPTRAFAALYELEKLVPDKAAFSLELVRATDDPRLRSTAAYLLSQQPPLLPDDVVKRLAASTLPREHDVLVPMLARHGAPAAALVPLCLELLENKPLADEESWNSRHLRWDRATTALVALIDVVDQVALEPLLAAMRSDTHRYRECGEKISAALAARPNAVTVSGLELAWTRWQRSDRVDSIRTFADGTRAEVVVTRRVERGTYASFVKHTSTIETLSGGAVDDRAPWHATDEAIARALTALAVPAPAASVRAISSDGRLMFFVLGRNPSESWDPDAGQLTSYDVTVALWDDVARAWRWETAYSLNGLGVGTWLLEHASFALTFDETGIIGRGSREESTQAYSIGDGRPRVLAPTDRMPRPNGLGDGTVLAADRAVTRAIVARSMQVELWDLAADCVIGSLDLAPIDDVATAAAFVTPSGGFVLGTRLGRLLRFSDTPMAEPSDPPFL